MIVNPYINRHDIACQLYRNLELPPGVTNLMEFCTVHQQRYSQVDERNAGN